MRRPNTLWTREVMQGRPILQSELVIGCSHWEVDQVSAFIETSVVGEVILPQKNCILFQHILFLVFSICGGEDVFH